MLFYNEAAGWSCFGLILAVIFGFVIHYYWKKNKGVSKDKPFSPTSEGYEDLKFEKQRLEDKTDQLEEELRESKAQLSKYQEDLKTKQELELKFSVLEANHNSLKTNYDSVLKELAQLKGDSENLQTERIRLLNKETELTQKIQEKESKLEDKQESIRESSEKIQKLEVFIRKLQEESKQLEVEKERLSTEKNKLEELQQKSELGLTSLKNDYITLNEYKTNLLRENAELIEKTKHLLETQKSLESRYEHIWNFYENLRNNGIETNIEALLRYKQFHKDNLELIQAIKKKKEEEQDRISAGKNFERSWQEDLEKQFTTEELEFIDIIPQPQAEGKRGDYKVSFRDSKNSSTTSNQLHIYVEHKYTSKLENTVGELNAIKDEKMNEDLRIARDKVSKVGDYDFIFLITNREIGQERFREKGFFWISTDKDYQSFGLKPPSKYSSETKETKPSIVIMTREKSFEFIWNLYTLWQNCRTFNTSKSEDVFESKISEIFTSPEFKRDLLRWIDDSDQFNLSISEKMEKQWKILLDRVRIIAESWSKNKNKAYDLNRRAIDLKKNSDWDNSEQNEDSNLIKEEQIERNSPEREFSIIESNSLVALSNKSYLNNISREGESLK